MFYREFMAQENVDFDTMKMKLSDASSITDDMSRLVKYDEILTRYNLKDDSIDQNDFRYLKASF